MTKILQGDLPKKINVVVNHKIIGTAVFTDGVFETEDADVIKELKEYGYKIEEAAKPAEAIEIKEAETAPAEIETAKPKKKGGKNASLD